MNADELWNEYCVQCNEDINTAHQAWCFGGAPDELAVLVLDGMKTATCSWYDLYELDQDEPLPKAGDISVILNGNEDAICIIRTTRVYITRFLQVSEDHAYKEGEGDRSLEYWRKVHKDFFTYEASEYGLQFDENIN